MLMRVHHVALVGRLLVAAVGALFFFSLVLTTGAQQALSVQERLATHEAEIVHVTADQKAMTAEMTALNLRVAAQSDRLTRIETFGAACFVILTVLQLIGVISGKRLRLTGGGRGE